MKHQIVRCLGVVLTLLSITSYSQSVGIGTETPNSNAILELVAPNADQGLLVPRMSTAARIATTFTDNLSATDNGLLVFDEDEEKFYFWMTTQWVEIASGNIEALPVQTGQNNRYLQTDGTNAQWADIDFTTLANIPTGLADGDNDTQLSDADITALGYIKNADDADADASNEFQDLTLAGNTLSLTNSGVNVDLSPFAGTNTDNQTISLAGTDLTISGGNTLDVSSLVNDSDSDPTNEDQTVSAGTGISVNQVGDDFEVTNTSPDQTVSLSNGGNVTISGSYPSFTLAVPNNLDNDPTNEDQTVSAGTGISVNNVGDDYEVTNTSPDQTVSLSNGGNVTVTGTYPNFTLAVPNNLDNDPTNEDQTVSAGTGISINNVGDDFEVTNTSPDQTVSLANGGNVTITGTYPNFTLAVPTNNDNSATNEIELPTQTGQNGNFLTTDGSSPSWSSISQTQWNTNGTSINYTTGNVNIGSGTIPTSPLQISTGNSSSTVPQLTISESNATSDAATTFNNSGNAYTIGVDGTDDFFKISDATTLGSNDRLIIDNLGTVGIGVTPNAQFHVETNSIESTTARLTNSNAGAASKIGIMNELDNQGTSIKTGLWNDIDGTTGESDNIKGVYNIIDPTDGVTYGVHTQINAAGSGVRYGSYNEVSLPAGNASFIYGFRAQMDHDGTGDSFGFQANMLGSTSGRKYGIYTNGENFNYFEGNVGIGDVESDVELTIQSFNIGSILPLVRLNSGAGTSDASISYSVSGGNEFVVGVDASNGGFSISDGAVLGSGERLTIDNTGNVGVNQSAPSARLDVVGSTELNGAVDVQSTLDVTGQLTVTNDVEIPATSDYTYASAKTKVQSYHPTEFKILNVAGAAESILTPNSVFLYIYFDGGSGTGLAFSTANVKLPDNAIITQLDAWVVDNDASVSNSFTRVSLVRSETGVANGNLTMAIVQTTQATQSTAVTQLTDNTIFGGAVDNNTYSYRLSYQSNDNSSELQLHGVKITYTVSEVD